MPQKTLGRLVPSLPQLLRRSPDRTGSESSRTSLEQGSHKLNSCVADEGGEGAAEPIDIWRRSCPTQFGELRPSGYKVRQRLEGPAALGSSLRELRRYRLQWGPTIPGR